jgi:wyosine [tRNA(Phe)-imidazoG37] synthetase (radical SAM superfamily)
VTVATVFGPVPSRRLGRSLGVDPVPFKTCNWNCVYCQLGRTAPPTGERREYVPVDGIVAEVRTAVETQGEDAIDWITFVGSGETTLHSGLGRMLRGVRAVTSLPIAVLTNGSLLHLPEVREELSGADAVLPSLDAGTEDLYLRVNRPQPGFTFERLVDGLVAFRAEYAGWLWVEVMLVRGLNDTDEALESLAAVLRRVAPDEVHVNVPTRPPCEPWVDAPGEKTLQRAEAILGESARRVTPGEGWFDLTGSRDVVEALISVITRHPMSEEELEQALGRWPREEIEAALARLAASNRARLVERGGKRFWCYAGARFRPP